MERRRSPPRSRSTTAATRRCGRTSSTGSATSRPASCSATPAGRWSTWSATTAPASWTCSPRPASPAPHRGPPRPRRRSAAGWSSCAGRDCPPTRSLHGWPQKAPHSTAPAWARSSPRKASAGCCATPSPRPAPRRPPPAATLLAGLATLPKKSALTEYSYRTSHDHQRAFLTGLDTAMITAGLATAEQAIFDLDFHAVMHWGQDPALERHYVPTRSQRARSVLTFFAQDTGTHNLVYANADISKATQNREAIAFCDHWKNVSGTDPKMLVMDQKVTNQAVLGELDARGVKFLTLRMRSAALIQHIAGLTPKDYKTMALDRPGPHNRPKVHQDPAVKLTS